MLLWSFGKLRHLQHQCTLGTKHACPGQFPNQFAQLQGGCNVKATYQRKHPEHDVTNTAIVFVLVPSWFRGKSYLKYVLAFVLSWMHCTIEYCIDMPMLHAHHILHLTTTVSTSICLCGLRWRCISYLNCIGILFSGHWRDQASKSSRRSFCLQQIWRWYSYYEYVSLVVVVKIGDVRPKYNTSTGYIVGVRKSQTCLDHSLTYTKSSALNYPISTS